MEELAAIIKDYAKRHKKLNDRLVDLETKVFGHAKSGAVASGVKKTKAVTDLNKDKSPRQASSRMHL